MAVAKRGIYKDFKLKLANWEKKFGKKSSENSFCGCLKILRTLKNPVTQKNPEMLTSTS